MMKNEEISLMEKLILNKISHKNFIDDVMSLDQSTPDRINAISNLKVLENKKVKKILKRSKSSKDYYNLLSLTYFHLGQMTADKNNGDSLSYFKKSLEASNRLGFKRHTQWKTYIKGTIAYLTYDKNKLKKIIPLLEDGRNKSIIQHFLHGLEERGSIEYKKDYSILDK